MGKRIQAVVVLLGIVLSGLLAGCGVETGFVPDTVRPVVTSTTPAQAATGVSLNPPIAATFSKAMNASTLNATTFLVSGPGGAPVGGAVSYTAASKTATFTPASALALNTTYLATITTGAQDTASPANALAANYLWTFTTSPAPTPPTVISTTPANAATDVPVGQSLSAVLSTAMDPASITSSTFTVTAEGVAVTGTVAYTATGNVATFVPSASLPASTTLVATITTGAHNTAGTALASNYTWTFTTAAAPPAPTVTATNPANEASGVLTAITPSAVFSAAMAPATINTTTFTLTGPGGSAVAGTVSYSAANLTCTFTPAAPLAAGTTYVAMISTGAQNTAGTALGSSYSWTFTTAAAAPPPAAPTVTATNPANQATGIALGIAPSATFSTTMDPTTLNGTTFTLQAPGGTTVTGVVTYTSGTNTATFTPSESLAYGTTYIATIAAGAKNSAGAPLAAAYTWSFTTVASPALPTVILTVPANNATGVLLTQPVGATFSAAMNAATLTGATFTLATSAGVAAPGTVTYNTVTNTATLTPSANLTTSTTYVATITTGAQSSAGTALSANYVWVFRTVPAPTPPAVISTGPANNATGVALNQGLSAAFSEAMSTSTINGGTFTVTAPGGVAVEGTVSYAVGGSVATFTPAAPFSASRTYLATITTGARDLSGTALAANYVWTFTTGAAPDTTPPTVLATNPVSAQTGVPFNQAISAIFSKPLNPATINNSSFTLALPGGAAVNGLVSYAAISNTATFTPMTDLLPSTVYTATITTAVADLAGNTLPSSFVWTFTTGAAPNTTHPTVTLTNPAADSSNAPTTQTVSATFSEVMDPLTINTATFTLNGPGGTSVAATVTYNAITSVATLTPIVPLLAGTTYTATVTSGAADLAENALIAGETPNPWPFTTAEAVVPPPAPTVIATSPANSATGVALGQAVSATFSTPMAPTAQNGAAFTLQGPGGVAVAGVVTYAAETDTATFTPSVNLAYGTTYIATISAGAESSAGVPLGIPYTWSFTTIALPAPPTVILTVPANGATGVLLTQPVSATFSTAMNAATLTNVTFTLATSTGVAAPGIITYNAVTNTATFTPSENLSTNTTYVATVTTGAQSSSGTGLSANYVWVFRTAPAPTPPTVISTIPANNAAGVALNQGLSATFSEAMNAATVNGTTFTVTAPGGIAVEGTVSYAVAGSVATFTPAASFLPLTTYVATLTTGAQDLNGTALAASYVWTFTTGAAPDTTRPTVLATNPVPLQEDVPFNQAISAIFSKAMNPATINTTNFTLTLPGGAAVSGLVSYAAISNTATFTPISNLLPSTLYTATITTAAADLAGNTLLNNYAWTFTTGAAPNMTHPTVTLTNPIANASDIPLTQTVSATFSEVMDPLTINTATFTLTGPGQTLVPATVTYNAITSIATLTPTVALLASTTYTATVTSGAADLAENALISGETPNPWAFTTGEAVVVPPVNLATAALFGGFGGGAGITNMGTQTVVNGDIGTTGVSTLITGFHDNGPTCIYTETPLNIGYVNGSIDTAPPPPTVGCPTEGTAITSAIAAQASLDAGTAYTALVAFPNGQDVSTCAGCGGGSAGELGNRTLVAGIYKSAPGSYAITTGDLTLDAKGDANAFWVFQMSTTFTLGTPEGPRNVLLVNGAQAKNVFWQVGTAATINGIVGGGTMSGTIISQAGIAVSTAGVAAVTTINGRAIVLTGPLTLVNTVINVPAP